MLFLILDPDIRVREYLTNLLRSEFPGCGVTFASSRAEALDFTGRDSFDLILMEDVLEEDYFSTLEEFLSLGIPVIVTGSDPSERLIIETLQAGAADFLSKRNIKFGYLPTLIRRALARKKDPSLLPTLNAEIRTHRKEDLEERQRYQIARGILGEARRFEEGKSYLLIYLYISIPFVAVSGDERDEDLMGRQKRDLMSLLVDTPGKYGGTTWVKKEDLALFVFEPGAVMGAFLSILEMRGQIQLHNLTGDNLNGSFSLRAGITRSYAVYRENRGQIVSDGINLSAHMALGGGDDERILLVEDLHRELIPRARKYFFRDSPFEGYPVYRYETTA